MSLMSKTLGRALKKWSKPETRSDSERLKQFVADKRIIKLHFGCGPRVLKGWINIDLAFEPFENYLQYYGDRFYPQEARGDKSDFFALDVTKERLPLDDNTVDVVFHEDFIEHLDQRSQFFFLAETLRVLKPNGIHRVNTPDLKKSMQKHSDFSRGAAGVYFGEWDRHGHKSVLTRSMLTEIATMIGYKEVRFTKRDCSAFPLLPPEYRPDPNDREEDGNIFADLVK
jgi:SAM-dependent methyltransferase